jgi:glycoprotein endo-alpha-1,2-mannosidase
MRKPRLLLLFTLAVACSFCSPLTAQTELDALAERARIEYVDVPRKVLAFYYPWYGNPEVEGGSGRWAHWSKVDEAKRQIGSSTHYPTLGPYDSHDPALIARHCASAKQAGIDALVVSWWGKGSFSDQAMGRILDGCRDAGLEATIYYETVPRPRDAQRAANDVLDVLHRYADHPAWLSVDNKPVVFVYGRALGEIGQGGWAEAISQVNRRYPRKAVFFGDQLSRSAARVFDGIHTYNTAGHLRGKQPADAGQWAAEAYPAWVQAADAFRRISTLTVIPGYDDTKIRKPGLRVERYDGALYRTQWEQAIEADPHWVLITSWNEWHEGSEVEPSHEDGDTYLKMTAELAARFKSKPRPAKPRPDSQDTGISEKEKLEQLAKLRDVKIGLLPQPDLSTLWPLLRLPNRPTLLSWEQVANWTAAAAKEFPVLIYAADETYRRTVDRPGDVDEGLLRYLEAGGLLVVLPTGPMPFHYDEEDRGVGGSGKLGLPLSVAGPDGGWEEPPEGVDLRFVQVGRQLPHVPATVAFPKQGDLRWRPFVRSRLTEEDHVVPLIELRDAEGKHYGDAAAYVEHKASEPKGGKILYVWFSLLESPHGEALLHDLFGWIGEIVAAK